MRQVEESSNPQRGCPRPPPAGSPCRSLTGLVATSLVTLLLAGFGMRSQQLLFSLRHKRGRSVAARGPPGSPGSSPRATHQQQGGKTPGQGQEGGAPGREGGRAPHSPGEAEVGRESHSQDDGAQPEHQQPEPAPGIWARNTS